MPYLISGALPRPASHRQISVAASLGPPERVAVGADGLTVRTRGRAGA